MMGQLRSIVREILGLFVDDGSFAIAILGWLAIAVLLSRIIPARRWTGPVLFVGLAAILIESALRNSGRNGDS